MSGGSGSSSSSGYGYGSFSRVNNNTMRYTREQQQLHLEREQQLHLKREQKLHLEREQQLHLEREQQLHLEREQQLHLESEQQLHLESEQQLHLEREQQLHLESEQQGEIDEFDLDETDLDRDWNQKHSNKQESFAHMHVHMQESLKDLDDTYLGKQSFEPFKSSKSSKSFKLFKPLNNQPIMTTYYSSTPGEQQKYEKETIEILCETFPGLNKTDTGNESLENFFKRFEESTNNAHSVEKVEVIQNESQYAMHNSFAELYNVENHQMRVNYFSSENADDIAINGFRSAASKVDDFGQGIYTYSDVWNAIANSEKHSKRYSEDKFTKVLRVRVLIGPSTKGWKGRSDFGKDACGKPYLTLTDPTETVFCSLYESQLLATAIITLKNKYKPCINSKAQPLAGGHSAIGNSAGSHSAATGAATGAATSAAAIGWYNRGFSAGTIDWRCTEGQVVKIIGDIPIKNYNKFRDYVGVIRCIKLVNKLVKTHCLAAIYFIQLVLDQNNEPVNALNINTEIARINPNTGFLAKLEGRNRFCLILDSKYIKREFIEHVHGAVADTAINASAASWTDSVGAPAIYEPCKSWTNSRHYDFTVKQRVLMRNFGNSKKFEMYKNYNDWCGSIKAIFARGVDDYIFFVEPDKTSDDKSAPSTTNENIRQLNVNCSPSPFPKCLLNTGMAYYIPCRSTHILEATIFTIHCLQLNRDNKKRAAMNAVDASGAFGASGASGTSGASGASGASDASGASSATDTINSGASSTIVADVVSATDQPSTKKTRI